MAEKGSKWLWGCSIALLLLLAIVVLTLFGIRWYVARMVEADMTPEEIAQMERFFNEPVEIPKAWQEVEPYPDELTEAAINLQNRWEPMGEFPQWFDSSSGPLYKLRQGQALTSEEWDEMGQMVEYYEDFLPAVTKFVNLPGYELQAFSGKDAADKLFIVVPNFLLIQRVTKLFCLQAYSLAHEGQWEPAFEAALTALRLTQRHPASSLITHLIAIGCEGIAVECVGSLATRCDDPAILRATLEEMNRLDPLINLNNLDQAVLIDHIAALRECKRQGYPVDLSSGKPGAYYFRQHLQLAQRVGGASPGGNLPGFAPGMVEKVLYKIAAPNMEEAHARERAAKAKFDLARILSARRIEQLESGTAPQDASQRVSEYFPEPLRDPFSDVAYVWDASRELFYSIGPDKRSDHNRIRYDPTNGTVSAGDIALF